MSTTATDAPRDSIVGYLDGFRVLRDARPEYWGLQLVNLLDMTAYFALINIVVVMLSDTFGFNDIHAGYVWTAANALITLSMFFTGALTDLLGIRKALYVSMIGNVVGRAGLMLAGLLSDASLRSLTAPLGVDALIGWCQAAGASPSLDARAVLAVISLFVLAPFLGMSSTIYQAGNRRFTTARARGAGYNLWYVIMNVGAFLGGVLVDVVRLSLGLDMVHIVTAGAVMCFVGFGFAAVLIRDERQVVGPGEVDEPPARSGRGLLSQWAAVIREPVFWRFMVLVVLILGPRAIFIHLHTLYPKYWERVIGEGAMIGTLQAINPILVVIGLVLLIPIVNRYSVYGMLTWGAIVSSLSLFVLAIPAHGDAVYWTSFLSLVVLTVGEVIWSPRLYEFTGAIAPRGQEGVYYGLSVMPWFLAKMVASGFSGHMLEAYVPEPQPGEPILRDRLAAGDVPFWSSPSALFLLLGVVTVIGPLIAVALRGWLTKGAHFEERRQAT